MADPSPPATVRYLSLEWFRVLSAEVERSAALREAAEHHDIAVTQVVTGGPEGDVTYHFVVGGGEASFGTGPADDEDVKMEQSWSTAVAVATGRMNAQDAFINGHIRLFGDQEKLMESRPVFGALDRVFATVGEHTRYE
jgi:putative sterol carrier protein